MKTLLRRFSLVAVGALALLLLAETPAHAQVGRPGGPQPVVVPVVPTYVNPYTILPNGMTLNQYASNISILANAYAQIPPWLLGYNPYPSPVLNYGPTYVAPAYTPPLFGTTYPMLSPFAAPNFYTNPYFTFFRTFP
jgi:hypothetical protein